MNYIKMIEKEEQKDMSKIFFRLSDGEKYDQLWRALNPDWNEEGNWAVDYTICDVFDDYALCRTKGKYCRVFYSKVDDTVIIGDIVEVFVVDVTKAEYDALEIMKAMGDGNFEKAEKTYSEKISELETNNIEFSAKVQELETGNTEFAAKVQELESSKETYERQIDELNAEKVGLNSQIDDMNNERQILVEFKANVEKAQKQEILKDFTGSLTQEAIDTFSEKMADYSIEDFTKEISFAAYQANPALFSKNPSEGLIYKNDGDKCESGIISILKKHKGGK